MASKKELIDKKIQDSIMTNNSCIRLFTAVLILLFTLEVFLRTYNIPLILFCIIFIIIIKKSLPLKNREKSFLIFLLLLNIVILITSFGFDWYNSLNLLNPSTGTSYDGVIYVKYAKQVSETLFETDFSNIPLREKGIVYVFAVLFLSFGANDWVIVLFNSLTIVSTGILIFLIGNRWHWKVGILAATFFCLLPEGLVWAFELRKDNMVVLLTTGLLYTLIRFFFDRKKSYLFLFFTLLIPLSFIRSGLVLVSITCLLLFIFWDNVKKKSHIQALVLLAIVVVIAFIFVPLDMSAKVLTAPLAQLIKGDQYLFDRVFSYAESKETSIVANLTGDLSIRNIYKLPLRIFFYYVSPFPPIRIRDYSDFVVNPSTWFLLMLLPFIILGVIYFFKQKSSEYKLINIYLYGFMIAMAFAGPFVTERYRLMTLPILFLMASERILKMSKKQMFNLFLSSPIFILILFVIYFLIKQILKM